MILTLIFMLTRLLSGYGCRCGRGCGCGWGVSSLIDEVRGLILWVGR